MHVFQASCDFLVDSDGNYGIIVILISMGFVGNKAAAMARRAAVLAFAYVLIVSAAVSAELPDTLVLALDGIPYELIQNAQRRGRFKDFHPASKLISTFPSLSDAAFYDIFDCGKPMGYQRVHYSPEKNKVVGMFINELISPEEYQFRFDSVHNGKFHYVMIYVMSNTMAKMELSAMKKDFFKSGDTDVFFTFIEATDAVLHKYGREKATIFLNLLDKTLLEMQQQYFEATGKMLEILMMSDHGNTMVKGKTITIKKHLKKLGYKPSNRLKGPEYVTWTASGIISAAVIYTFEETEERLSKDLLALEGVDLAFYDKSGEQYVLGDEGLAKIVYDPEKNRGKYEIITGDPLNYGPVMDKARDSGWMDDEGFVPQDKLFKLTVDHYYPDALWRVYFCFHGSVEHTANIVLSLKQGYEFANPVVKFLARLSRRAGTHGALAQIDSAGIIMTNFRPTEDVNTRLAGNYFDKTKFVRKKPRNRISKMVARIQYRIKNRNNRHNAR